MEYRHPSSTAYIDPLTRLSIKFGSDKFGGHQYTPEYHKLLCHLRDSPINLLEIGVGGYQSPQSGGASLRMWAEYFPYARIVGLDLMPKSIKISPRVSIVQGSQDDNLVLDKLAADYGPFNVVIDDGSHRPDHMVHSFSRLYPHIAGDGIYIVEDTQTCFIDNPQGTGTILEMANLIALQMQCNEGYRAPTMYTDVAMFAEMTKAVSFHGNFVSFHRGDNRYPSNFNLDLNDVNIERVYRAIEQEAISNPSDRNALSRIDMCIWAGDTERADMLAAEAMQQAPDNLSLMYELLRMMEWAKRYERAAELRRRIEAMNPVCRQT